MNKIVVDASALLALINQETGYQVVLEYLPNIIMSTVNLSEVATILSNNEMKSYEIQPIINELVTNIIDFDKDQAYFAASLRQKTKSKGLSFGDRACLSLAAIRNLPVLTADKVWSKLDLDLDIKVIR